MSQTSYKLRDHATLLVCLVLWIRYTKGEYEQLETAVSGRGLGRSVLWPLPALMVRARRRVLAPPFMKALWAHSFRESQ